MVLSMLSVMLLSGYKLLSNKEHLVTILPLPQVDTKFKQQKVWSYSIGNGVGNFYSNLHPTVQNKRVFVANRYGLVKALDADSGKELWVKDLSIYTGCFSRNKPAQLSGGVTAVGNRIYVASELAKVYALEAKCGNLAWEVMVAGETLSTPVVSDGVILVHTSNGMLQALNEANGALKWTVNLEAKMLNIRIGSTPTTAFGTAIVGSDNGLVSAVMLNVGQIIWQQRISQTGGVTEITRINNVATPVVINGYVYALAYNGNLAALDLFSGQLIWSREIGSVNNLLVENGIIYLVDQNDHVIAVDAKNGVTIWHQSALLHRNLTSPVLNKDYIVIGDSGGYLHWIHIDDGRLVAQKKIANASLLVTPIFDGDKIIVQATNGEVHAIIIH